MITLVVGHAISGGFLTHGYQANRILAFDDDGVMIHAMHKEAAARITRRSVEDSSSSARPSRRCPMTLRTTRSSVFFTNCCTSKIQRSRRPRKFSK